MLGKQALYQLRACCGHLKFLFLFMCMDVFPACMSIHHTSARPTDQKKADPLELDLSTVGVATWVLRNEPSAAGRIGSAFNRRAISPDHV